MSDKPRNGAMCSLKRKSLQWSSITRHTVHWLAQCPEMLGDVIGFLAMALKMPERRHELAATGSHTLVEQPTNEHKVSRSPTCTEQGSRVANPPIKARRIYFGTVLVKNLGHSHLSCHAILSMSLPIRRTRDVQWRHPFGSRLHIRVKAGICTRPT